MCLCAGDLKTRVRERERDAAGWLGLFKSPVERKNQMNFGHLDFHVVSQVDFQVNRVDALDSNVIRVEIHMEISGLKCIRGSFQQGLERVTLQNTSIVKNVNCIQQQKNVLDLCATFYTPRSHGLLQKEMMKLRKAQQKLADFSKYLVMISLNISCSRIFITYEEFQEFLQLQCLPCCCMLHKIFACNL